MSASLVGSEMCIRDRRLGYSRAARRAPSSWPRRDCLRQGRPPASPASPVSYTHLTLPTICSV
eukprot:5568716-Alexandrium_andersonii.AAC.1